jgi:hypothetical protein
MSYREPRLRMVKPETLLDLLPRTKSLGCTQAIAVHKQQPPSPQKTQTNSFMGKTTLRFRNLSEASKYAYGGDKHVLEDLMKHSEQEKTYKEESTMSQAFKQSFKITNHAISSRAPAWETPSIKIQLEEGSEQPPQKLGRSLHRIHRKENSLSESSVMKDQLVSFKELSHLNNMKNSKQESMIIKSSKSFKRMRSFNHDMDDGSPLMDAAEIERANAIAMKRASIVSLAPSHSGFLGPQSIRQDLVKDYKNFLTIQNDCTKLSRNLDMIVHDEDINRMKKFKQATHIMKKTTPSILKFAEIMGFKSKKAANGGLELEDLLDLRLPEKIKREYDDTKVQTLINRYLEVAPLTQTVCTNIGQFDIKEMMKKMPPAQGNNKQRSEATKSRIKNKRLIADKGKQQVQGPLTMARLTRNPALLKILENKNQASESELSLQNIFGGKTGSTKGKEKTELSTNEYTIPWQAPKEILKKAYRPDLPPFSFNLSSLPPEDLIARKMDFLSAGVHKRKQAPNPSPEPEEDDVLESFRREMREKVP